MALKMITWNANGIIDKKANLKVLVVLISETHLNDQSYIKISVYTTYFTPHKKCKEDRDYKKHAGTAVIIINSIRHFSNAEMCEAFVQATSVTVIHNNVELVLAAA